MTRAQAFLLLLLAVLLARATEAAAARELRQLWRTDIYTNYPRNYGPGIVRTDPVTGLPQLFVQGTFNCATFMSVVSLNPFHGALTWRNRELPDPSYCGFHEQPPIVRGVYMYVDDPADGFTLPTLRAYQIHNGSSAWTLTIGTSNSTNMLSNIAVDEPSGLAATSLLDMLYVVEAATGTILWQVNTTLPCWAVNVVRLENEDTSLLVCSTNNVVLSYNLTTGAALWSTVLGPASKSLFDGNVIGKPAFDVARQTLAVASDPANMTVGGFVSRVDLLSGNVVWNVSCGAGIQPLDVNVLSISNDVVLDIEMPMLWNASTFMVARDIETGDVAWNTTSPTGSFRSFTVEEGIIYALVGDVDIEARNVQDGSLIWAWHTDYCVRHHTIGVGCGLAQPYVWNGTLYVNFGYGEHDHVPFLALALPQPE